MLHYTLENGLSICLVTSYIDNFCTVSGFSDSCMSVFHRQRVAQEDLLVSKKVRKHLLKLHLMPIKSLSSSSASVALDIKKLSDPFRTAPDILPNGLQSLPPLSKSSMYVCVCLCGFTTCLHKVNKYVKMMLIDYILTELFIWLIKSNYCISIFAEKHRPNEDNSNTLSTLMQ